MSSASRGFGSNRANLVTTAVGFAVSLVVGFWFTPYLVHRLGAAEFGLIPLATTIVSYFSLLTQSLSATLTRSLSIALETQDRDRANRVFGTGLGTCLGLGALVAAPLAAVSWLAPRLFHVPPGSDLQVRLLFAIVAVNFLLSLVGASFNAVAFSRNRIYLNNLASIVQSALRVAVTVLLFAVAAPRVILAGVAMLVAAVVSFVMSVGFAKASVPWLRMKNAVYDPDRFKSFFRISSHQLVMQLGTVVVMSCEIVLANRLFGHVQAGRYAAVIQWLLFLRNAGMTLVVLFVPTMFALYANGDLDGLVRYTRRAMRWVGLSVALPTGFLIALAPQILTVWLGPGYRDLADVMVVQLAPLAAVSCVLPLYTISLAADRVLPSGIVQLLTGLVGIGLTLIAVEWGGQGLAAIALCVGWTLALKEFSFMPLYAANNIGRKPGAFFGPILQTLLLNVVSFGLFYAAGRIFPLDSYPSLAGAGLVLTFPYAAAALLISPNEDRQLVLITLSRVTNRTRAVAH